MGFERELAVMVARAPSGGGAPATRWSRPCSATTSATRSWRRRRSPPAAPPRRGQVAAGRGRAPCAALGVTGVEMFLAPDGEVLVNELAPRPHNSGHYTIEACETSQFENHLRGVLDLPLGDAGLRAPAAAMVNLLGAPRARRARDRRPRSPSRARTCTSTTRPRSAPAARWATSPPSPAPRDGARAAARARRPWRWGWSAAQPPLVGIVMGSDSDLPRS